MAGAPASAQPQPDTTVEEIVVTARRTGIPVWRVTGPTTSIVLVGSIEGVAKDTRWDPGALTEALRKADRVMFPQLMQLTASPFAMVGYLGKWRKQATLPKGQSLADLMTPEQFARLTALKDRGLLKPGFERKHPFHLAITLRDIAKGETKYGQDARQYVGRAIKDHKLEMVPIAKGKAKPVADDLFGSAPEAHLPCLLDALALVEAGSGIVKARSDAWAARRVADVLGSPAEKVYVSCWPAQAPRAADKAHAHAAVRRLLAEPQMTIVVLPLRTLAVPGGLLDELEAADFDVQGLDWRAADPA